MKKILIFIKKWLWVLLALVIAYILWDKLFRKRDDMPGYKKAKKTLLKNIEKADKEYWRLENEKKSPDDFKDYTQSDIYEFVRSVI